MEQTDLNSQLLLLFPLVLFLRSSLQDPVFKTKLNKTQMYRERPKNSTPSKFLLLCNYFLQSKIFSPGGRLIKAHKVKKQNQTKASKHTHTNKRRNLARLIK